MLKKILFSVLIGCTSYGYSQLPGTWSLNPADYNYSMTLTGAILNDCQNENDNANAIGAFVNGQCRGFVNTTVDNSESNKLGFLTIYSNSASGEDVELRFFIDATNMEITSLDSTVFISNNVIGSVADPFILTSNHAPTGVSLSNNLVLESSPIGSNIATVSGMDEDTWQTLSFSLPLAILDDDSFLINGTDLNLNAPLDFAVQDTFQIVIEVNDGQGCTFQDTLLILVDDFAYNPVAENDTVSVLEDTVGYFEVLLNDYDLDNNIDTMSLSIYQQPMYGTAYVDSGVVIYTPNENYNGQDTLIYVLCDLTNTGALCDTAIVFITVIPVPDPPVSYNDTISTPEEVAVFIPVLDNDTDVENDIDPTSVTVISGPTFGVTSTTASGEIIYTPNANYVGYDTLIYSVCDLTVPDPLCDTAMVVIEVIQVPDNPIDIVIDTLTIVEGNNYFALVDHMETIDDDLPFDSFTYTLVSGTGDEDNGQFSIDGSGLVLNTKAIFDIKSAYNVRIRTTDSFGLFYEEAFVIEILDDPNLDFQLPIGAYISNNGDSKNDYLSIENVVIYDYFTMKIFDQFGRIVFEKETGYNNEFDGKVNEEILPEGTYYYIFSSEKKTFKGYITIVN